MLDLNGWFFAQLINFVVLLLVLNTILYKPFLALFKERDENTKGALEKAKSLNADKDSVLAKLDAKLAERRAEAKVIFEGLSKDGNDVQRQEMEAAQNEAVDINRKAKEELKAATDKAREGLKSDIETFSKQIVEQLVGA